MSNSRTDCLFQPLAGHSLPALGRDRLSLLYLDSVFSFVANTRLICHRRVTGHIYYEYDSVKKNMRKVVLSNFKLIYQK